MSRVKSVLGNADVPKTSSESAMVLLQSMLEECTKQEPYMPGDKMKVARLLDGSGAFGRGIGFEVSCLLCPVWTSKSGFFRNVFY